MIEVVKSAILGKNISLGENVKIGDRCKIGDNVTIGDGVVIAEKCRIENNVSIGYPTLSKKKDYYKDFPTTIGKNCLIRSGAIIYRACKLGENNWINNYVILRENTILGDNNVIGSHMMCEGYTEIGNMVSIYSLCALGGNMVVEDRVFIGPNVTTANNPRALHGRGTISSTKRWEKDGLKIIDKGPTIRFGARIGIAAVLLADIEIGREAMVAAGAIVTKDVSPFSIVRGIPAKVVGSVPEHERFGE